MKSILTAAAMLFSVGLFMSAAAQTALDHLSSGTWKVMAIGIDTSGDGVAERTIMRPCHVGSTLLFAVDGTGKSYKGPSPCNANGPSTSSFTWQSKGGDIIEVMANGKSEQWKIISATHTKLVLWMTGSRILETLSKPE